MGGQPVRVVLRDGARALAVGEREWRLLAAMDGTRDLEGVALAAGFAGPPAELASFLERLADLGLLEQGPPAVELAPALAADRPVRVLEGLTFRCDGRGDCCRRFETVLFSPLEQARARAAEPEVLGGGERSDRVFLPVRGADDSLGAVTLVDGACAYHGSDGRCRVHASRPHGCRTFPRTYLDDGAAIRVSLRPECACVFAEDRDAEADRVTEPARSAALPRALFVPRLPERVRMRRSGAEVPRREYLRWLDALSEALDVAGLEAAADALDGVPAGRPPEVGLVGAGRVGAGRVEGWRARVDAARRVEAFRASSDVTRRGLDALAEALARLSEPRARGTLPPVRGEARFWRLRRFVLEPTPSAADALRGLAWLIRLARAVGDGPAGDAPGAPALAAVAALTRAHALDQGTQP